MIAHKFYQIIMETPYKEQPKELIALAKKLTLLELVYKKFHKKLNLKQFIFVYQNLQESPKLSINLYQENDIQNPLNLDQEEELTMTVTTTFKNTMSKLPCTNCSEFFIDFLKKRYPYFHAESELLHTNFKHLTDQYIEKLCNEAEPEDLFSDIKNAAQTS